MIRLGATGWSIAVGIAAVTVGGQAFAQEASATRVYACDAGSTGVEWTSAIVETTMSESELERAWSEHSKSRYNNVKTADCTAFASKQAVQQQLAIWQRQNAGTPFKVVDFDPSGGGAGSRKIAKVLFPTPNRYGRDWGFTAASFDIEYQLIPCFGELHIAYSVIEDSVKHAGKPNYFFEGKWHTVSGDNLKVISIPISGIVYVPPYHTDPVGRFGDGAAAKALGFGCFSGQTKKVANMKDLVGENPDKEKVQKYLDSLVASFKVTELLTSATAEQEIRNGLAAAGTTNDGQGAGNSDDELRAQARAAKEAEFLAARKKFEEDLAAQQKAVADFKEAQDKVAADAAANAERARQAQEQAARERAAYEAELARHRQQQADYEAKIGAGSVKLPPR